MSVISTEFGEGLIYSGYIKVFTALLEIACNKWDQDKIMSELMWYNLQNSSKHKYKQFSNEIEYMYNKSVHTSWLIKTLL